MLHLKEPCMDFFSFSLSLSRSRLVPLAILLTSDPGSNAPGNERSTNDVHKWAIAWQERTVQWNMHTCSGYCSRADINEHNSFPLPRRISFWLHSRNIYLSRSCRFVRLDGVQGLRSLRAGVTLRTTAPFMTPVKWVWRGIGCVRFDRIMEEVETNG